MNVPAAHALECHAAQVFDALRKFYGAGFGHLQGLHELSKGILNNGFPGPRHQRVNGVGFGRFHIDWCEGEEQIRLLEQHQPLKKVFVHLALKVGLLGFIFPVRTVVVDVGFLNDGAHRQRAHDAHEGSLEGIVIFDGPALHFGGLHQESHGDPAIFENNLVLLVGMYRHHRAKRGRFWFFCHQEELVKAPRTGGGAE